MRWLRRSFVVTAVLVVAVVAVVWGLRSRYRRWGARDEDFWREWPDTGLVEDPGDLGVRAIEIDAPPAEVWPWVAQMGQDRAGMYSYTVLENAVGAAMHNVDRIEPQWQARSVGDRVWLGPPERYGGKAVQRVARLEPGHAIVMMGDDDWDRVREGGLARRGTWSFVVEHDGDDRSRLVALSRGGHHHAPYDFVHFVMERGMLRGIKQRVEAAHRAVL